jgi:hypothetical protein
MIGRKLVETMIVGNIKEIGTDGWIIAKIEETTYQSSINSMVFRL